MKNSNDSQIQIGSREVLSMFVLDIPSGSQSASLAAASHVEKSFKHVEKVIGDSAMLISPSFSVEEKTRTLTIDYLTTRERSGKVCFFAEYLESNRIPIQSDDNRLSGPPPHTTAQLASTATKRLPTAQHYEVLSKLPDRESWFGQCELMFPAKNSTARYVRILVCDAENYDRNKPHRLADSNIEWVERLKNSIGLGKYQESSILAFPVTAKSVQKRLGDLVDYAKGRNLIKTRDATDWAKIEEDLTHAIATGQHPELLNEKLDKTCERAIVGKQKFHRHDEAKRKAKTGAKFHNSLVQETSDLALATDVNVAIQAFAAIQKSNHDEELAVYVLKQRFMYNLSTREIATTLGHSEHSKVYRMSNAGAEFLRRRLSDYWLED